jgi:hypothetical protein
MWASYAWKALGAAVDGAYACVWFGVDKDCFIATAAYGSPVAAEVQFLRRYRENVVKKDRWGRACLSAFEKFYYSFSPRLAELITGRNTLRCLARIFVADPIVDMLLIGSFAFRSGRKRLAHFEKTHRRVLGGIIVRGLGGWLFSISWIVWNGLLAYSFFRPEAFLSAAAVWIPMISGLILTRIGAWIHKDIDFSTVTPI